MCYYLNQKIKCPAIFMQIPIFKSICFERHLYLLKNNSKKKWWMQLTKHSFVQSQSMFGQCS